MTLQLEVGKYYKNRNGDKVFIKSTDNHPTFPFDAQGGRSYTNFGREYINRQSNNDLIEEWKDEETIIKANEHDPVNHPQHYTSHPSGIECIQITRHMGFNLGNAIKYVWRADLKNGIEDLEKAKWYIQDEIDKRKAQS